MAVGADQLAGDVGVGGRAEEDNQAGDLAGLADPSAGQNFLLAELRDEEPLTTGELARRMHVEVPTVVKMAQRMESAGLLGRRPDPGDGRRVLIRLTAQGREAAERIPALLDAVSEQALAGLDDTERETLISLLQRVAASLGWPPPPSRKRYRG